MSAIKFDIFVPNHSHGLMVDARILQKAIGADQARIISLPSQAYTQSLGGNLDGIELESFGESAIFIEHVFEHAILTQYKRKILVPNPEWYTSKVKLISGTHVSEIWHKTSFGMSIFEKLHPDKKHGLIGFTSFDLDATVSDYSQFGHFSGKSKTRHTQELMDIWLQEPELPTLNVQFYDKGPEIPEWIRLRNLNIRMGFMAPKELRNIFTQTGIHLCTSQMEGFGHYINEARSIGALIIALDAPPMNELIDAQSGILVKTDKYLSHNHGVKFIASKDAIHAAIKTALGLSETEKFTLGQNAKARYFSEREKFLHAIRSLTA